MSSEGNAGGKRYLRGDVEVEPLVDRWYAWIHLVAPATAAFNVVERHVRMMESFVRSPALHAAAASNPTTRSGPFLDLGVDRVADVQRLLDETRSRIGPRAEFVDAVRALDRMLAAEATGGSLEPLYRRVPGPLQGLVELCYDRHHRAGARFHEALLYATDIHDPSSQCVRLTRPQGDDARSFVFSTPRLADDDGGEGDGAVELAVPFASPVLDDLFRARTDAVDVTDLALRLGLAPDTTAFDRFLDLFSEALPAPHSTRPSVSAGDGDAGARVTYFGHACLLIEDEQTSILVDPVLGYDHPSDVPRCSYADLPAEIDYVLITHAHHDHLLPETLLQIRHKVGTVIVPANDGGGLMDPSLRLVLEHLGFERVREVHELDAIPIPGGAITAVPFVGEHHDLDVRSKTTYHVRISGRSILVAADTANIDPMLYRRVHDLVGDVDLHFLGMECEGAPASWVYGPFFSSPLDRDHDQSRRGRASTSAEALELVERFASRSVYVYAMGEEPWLAHLLGVHYSDDAVPIVESERLLAECRLAGRTAERLFGYKQLCWP